MRHRPVDQGRPATRWWPGRPISGHIELHNDVIWPHVGSGGSGGPTVTASASVRSKGGTHRDSTSD